MVKILRNIFVFMFAAAECDLIGYNRLGNNVGQHIRYRFGKTVETNRYQILQWMMSDKTLSTTEKRKWFQKLNKGSNARKPTNARTNRRNIYRRTMLKNED